LFLDGIYFLMEGINNFTMQLIVMMRLFEIVTLSQISYKLFPLRSMS
jgi:hypothetical protein